MIVADYPDGDLLTAMQVDHALLGGQIARAWQKPAFLSQALWDQFALAMDHHDDGWKLVDDDPLLDKQGRPLNFRICPTYRHIATWQHSLDHAIALGDYARLLIAAHGRWLFTTFPSVDDNARDAAVYIVDQIDHIMAKLLDNLAGDPAYAQAIEPSHFDQTQKLFMCFDAMSLMMLRGVDWFSQFEGVPIGDDVATLKLKSEMCSARWARLSPWPFVTDDVSFSAPIRRIPGRAYASSHDLHDTLAQTAPVTRFWSMGRL